MMKKMMMEFWKDEQGQDVVEYSLLLALIGTCSIFVLTLLGLSISQMFATPNTLLETCARMPDERFR